MISIKFIWILIVGVALLTILAYLFYTGMTAMNHKRKHRFIEIDHYETFCDNDDCDDYE